MNEINYQVLREAAESASKINWTGLEDDLNADGYMRTLTRYIQCHSPIITLSLLDERDALNKRIAELEANLAAMTEDHQKAIESIKQADAAVKLAHEKFSALASLEAEPVAWRYRYVKKGVTDFKGEPWVGDWKYVPTKEDCNDRPNYEIQALFTAQPVPLTPEGLIKAVRFYEQVKRENPPVETGAWKDAVDWVLKEACQVVNTGIKGD
ncbi:TPA: ead/Ea22-like family protein [Escherichia coli]|nr:ead/Ea22-like family protein [Escherichia coli]